MFWLSGGTRGINMAQQNPVMEDCIFAQLSSPHFTFHELAVVWLRTPCLASFQKLLFATWTIKAIIIKFDAHLLHPGEKSGGLSKASCKSVLSVTIKVFVFLSRHNCLN